MTPGLGVPVLSMVLSTMKYLWSPGTDLDLGSQSFFPPVPLVSVW